MGSLLGQGRDICCRESSIPDGLGRERGMPRGPQLRGGPFASIAFPSLASCKKQHGMWEEALRLCFYLPRKGSSRLLHT